MPGVSGLNDIKLYIKEYYIDNLSLATQSDREAIFFSPHSFEISLHLLLIRIFQKNF